MLLFVCFPNLFLLQATTFVCEEFENRLLKEATFRNGLLAKFPPESSASSGGGDDTGTTNIGPPQAPEIVQKPKNIFCHEGDDLTFQTKVSGSPLPRVYWFKNGAPLVPSSRTRTEYRDGVVLLHIHMLLPEDAACYTLLTENAHGLAIFSIKLNINYVLSTNDENVNPQLQQQMTRKTTTTSTAVNTSTNISTNITTGSFKSSTDRYSSDFQTGDGGGDDNSLLITSSGIKPRFYLIPYDVEGAHFGSIVRLECRVSGRPEPEVSWYKDDCPHRILDNEHIKAVVNEEGNYALLILGAEPADSATYRCEAVNHNGSASFTVRLTVQPRPTTAAPKFTERFLNTSARAGEAVVLACRAQGTPTPSMSWQKDGIQVEACLPETEIRESASVDGSGTASSSLHLNSLAPRDAGWYQCTAQNTVGSVATRARLTVETPHRPPPTAQPVTLHLPRTHRRIDPPTGEPYETITLRHVSKVYEQYDSVDRNLVAEQQHQQQISSSSSVSQQQQPRPPTFSSALRDALHLNVGDRAHFEAHLSSVDDAGSTVIEWYLNGVLLVPSERVVITSRYGYVALTLLSVQAADSGTLTVRVCNRFGEASSSAQLKVSESLVGSTSLVQQQVVHQIGEGEGDQECLQRYQSVEDSAFFRHQRQIEETRVQRTKQVTSSPLAFVRPLQPSTVVAPAGGRVVLEGQISGLQPNDPSVAVEWFINGQPVRGGDPRINTSFNSYGVLSLSLADARPEDSGVFGVRVTVGGAGSSGEAISTASVKVVQGKWSLIPVENFSVLKEFCSPKQRNQRSTSRRRWKR